MKVTKVGIIGGGAAGMTAAIFAARSGAKVQIFESNDRLGKKILSTGNGKCNLGNQELSIDKYYTQNPEILEGFLKQFRTCHTIEFFKSLGLLVTDKNGYLYPQSEQAQVVLDVLRYEIERNPNIEVMFSCKINGIKRIKEGIQVSSDEKRYIVDNVILACGGKAAPKTGSDGSGYQLAEALGHKITPIVPALVQLRCREKWLKAVAGVRANAKITVETKETRKILDRGEVQFTDYGISGIPVFQISREVNYILSKLNEVKIKIDLFPDYTEEELSRLIINSRVPRRNCKTAEEYFSGILNKKLMSAILGIHQVKNFSSPVELTEKKIMEIIKGCKNLCVTATGSNSFEQAQVCAGGVLLSELDDTLQSKEFSSVYLVGELLDVDGKCGGYNLHWAWCSGSIAGTAAAKGRNPYAKN